METLLEKLNYQPNGFTLFYENATILFFYRSLIDLVGLCYFVGYESDSLRSL